MTAINYDASTGSQSQQLNAQKSVDQIQEVVSNAWLESCAIVALI